MQPRHLTKSQFKIFLLYHQGLIGQEASEEIDIELQIERTVKKLGCIQYDPLNVVGKNPDLVLQSRLTGYKQGDIDGPLYKSRTLMDAWDKMMSIYPAEDFANFTRLRNRKAVEIQNVLKHRKSDHALSFCQKALDILEEKGPLLASQMDFGNTEKGLWGHGKLSSATLDYLFNSGKLGIHSKRNTQKVYDIMERLLPADILEKPDPFETEEAFTKWYIKRRIKGFGAYWSKSGGGWLGHFIYKTDTRKKWIHEMVESGELIVLSVEGFKELFYMCTETLETLEKSLAIEVSTAPRAVKFLAPLDNLLWDRALLKSLFDFNYTWEVYKPVELRQYGYYVLPVLYGDKIIARFEPKLYREGRAFEIESWWWEKGIVVDQEMLSACALGIQNFATYLGANDIIDYTLTDRHKLNRSHKSNDENN